MASVPLLDRALLESWRLTIHWQVLLRAGGRAHQVALLRRRQNFDHRNFHQGDDLRAVNWRAFSV